MKILEVEQIITLQGPPVSSRSGLLLANLTRGALRGCGTTTDLDNQRDGEQDDAAE